MNKKTEIIDEKERDIEVKHFIKKMKKKQKLNHEILSYNMIINGRWGDGKTTFLKQIKDHLRDNKDTEIKLDDIITISAWDYDFLNDPTEMILNILNNNGTKNDVIKEIRKQIKKFLEGFSEEAIRQNKFFSSLYKGFKEVNNMEESSSKNYLSFIDLKNQIQENIKKMNSNVYIFIDDLDRCNSNFVIRLIEITKHLFNIENVVIIYMLDLKNINHSIIKYYNLLEDSDANETYLSKIIDYVHDLEEVDKTTYLLNRYDLSWVIKKTNRSSYQKVFINLQNETFRKQKYIVSKLKKIENIIIDQKIEDPEGEVKTIIIFSIIQYFCENKNDLIKKILNNVIDQEISNNKTPRDNRQSTRDNLNKIMCFFENIYINEGIGSSFPYKNFSSTDLNKMFEIDFKKLFNFAINTY